MRVDIVRALRGNAKRDREAENRLTCLSKGRYIRRHTKRHHNFRKEIKLRTLRITSHSS